MINIVIHKNEIDPLLWSELVSYSPQDIHSIYQTYEWAHLMNESYSFIPIFLLVYEDSKIIGGQLFFEKPIFSLFKAFESQGGPLVIDQDNFETVETAIIENYGKIRDLSLYILTRPKISTNSSIRYLEKGFRKSIFYTFLLNLNKNENELWESFHKHIRNSVRKAEKSKLKFIEADNWEKWSKFYQLHIDHSNKRGIAPKNQKFIEILYNRFIPKDMVRLFIAIEEDRVIGGMLFLQYQNIMTYYVGASDDNYCKCSPNDFLMWNSIQWGIRNGIEILDLGDTWPNPKSHLYSIHKFKEKWGGILIRSDFYIKGRLYYIGRKAVLNNKLFQLIYEYSHKNNFI